MDINHIIGDLNDEQRQAVTTESQNVLVLAGAGSGKTRVLVHRIAWQIEVLGVNPFAILAVTFTNKAAYEMRQRIAEILTIPTGGLWVGTFHSIAQRLLRRHYAEANLPQNFQILDSDDQLRLVKRIMRELEIDEKRWSPKQAQWYINGCKDEGLRPQHIQEDGDIFTQIHLKIYHAYQASCDQLGLVDFAELLLRSHELWLHQPDVLAHYQNRFSHILVDEFQDTNSIQYAWLRMLSQGTTSHMMAVGDDDQSIYGWRGAKIENIQQFSTDYTATEIVRLEQNYRSTGTILAAANAVISHNDNRLGKKLWTDGAAGEPLYLYNAYNEIDEANFVAERIQQQHEQATNLSEMAILYRSNAQSRILEESLIRQGIAYRIYGGMRFFERAEIKSALAYMQVLENPHADAAFERIVNFPSRGIGDKTLNHLREHARLHSCSLWAATEHIVQHKTLSGRALNAISHFHELISGMRTLIAQDELSHHLEKMFKTVIEQSGLLAHYQKDTSEKGHARVENLQELIVAAKQFDDSLGEAPAEADTDNPLINFLDHAALEAGDAQASQDEDAVQLMTLHSAKGLEFATVFMVGLEEILFPSKRSIEEGGLDEERRLCYVGITRAKQQLYLCHAQMRRLYGEESYRQPSRFIREIPAELIEHIRPQIRSGRHDSSADFSAKKQHGAETDATGLQLGDLVNHPKFGEGSIINCEGRGAHARLQVNFNEYGSKWLVLQYANLTKL